MSRIRFSTKAFAGIALCSVAVLAAPLIGAAEPSGGTIFTPTPKGSGKPVTINHGQYTKKSGILSCSTLVFDNCIVTDMPLLSQGDPKVGAAIQTYLQQYAVGGLVADQNGVKRPVAAYAQLFLDFGCYDTSIVTVINAALAHRRADIVLSKRTKEFDDKAASGGLSKPEQQLLWQYQLSYEAVHKMVKNGKVVQPMYFHEAVADIGGGIKDACDPYTYGSCGTATAVNGKGRALRKFNPSKTEITDAAVKDLLRKGNMVLLAYKRYNPTVAVDPKTGVRTVTLKFAGLHKVVVSGFQTGSYQLLINDVGDGNRHKVRLSSTLNALHFGPRSGGSPTQIKSTKFVFERQDGITTPTTDTPFLMYEDEDKATNPQIRFMDHYDTLQIAAK
jgi:hypothetical protein